MRTRALSLVVLLSLARVASPQGVPLGPEFRVNTYTTDIQANASVAVDGSGNFVVVWESAQDPGSGVFGQRYASGGVPVGPEFPVNSYTTGGQGLGWVASDPSGNFVVVWTSAADGSSYGVFGQRYASSGAPAGTEFRVNTYTTSFQGYSSVAADSSGNFVVVWESDQDGAGNGIFGQRFDSSGAPAGTEFRVNTYTTGPQYSPHIASDAAGNFVVIWSSDQDGSADGVFGQRFASSGAPLGPEFRVNTFTTSGQHRPFVAADPSGNFVAIWASQSQDGSGAGIFAQRFASSGAPLGTEFRVNTFTTGYQEIASVAADSFGNFVVVWESPQDGSNSGIFGQRFDSAGNPMDSEFLINTYTTSEQDDPSVAAEPTGNFVVVWTSLDQDGSSYGLFGQRYSQIVPVELMHFRIE